MGEGSEQGFAECRWCVEITIMSAVDPGIMPEPLSGIEVRRIGWQLKHLDVAVMGFEKG